MIQSIPLNQVSCISLSHFSQPLHERHGTPSARIRICSPLAHRQRKFTGGLVTRRTRFVCLSFACVHVCAIVYLCICVLRVAYWDAAASKGKTRGYTQEATSFVAPQVSPQSSHPFSTSVACAFVCVFVI